jgi:hypothetical protein
MPVREAWRNDNPLLDQRPGQAAERRYFGYRSILYQSGTCIVVIEAVQGKILVE